MYRYRIHLVSREVSQYNLVDVAALPPFHVAGWFSQQSIPLGTGSSIMLWAPNGSSPPLPTPEMALQTARRGDPAVVWVVPSFLVTWMHSTEAVEYLKSRELVVNWVHPSRRALLS